MVGWSWSWVAFAALERGAFLPVFGLLTFRFCEKQGAQSACALNFEKIKTVQRLNCCLNGFDVARQGVYRSRCVFCDRYKNPSCSRGIFKMKKKAGVMVALCVWFGAAWATSGGVDRDGCHHSKKIGFHCHAQSIEKIEGYRAGENHTARGKRLRAQCQGQKNDGVCSGYVN